MRDDGALATDTDLSRIPLHGKQRPSPFHASLEKFSHLMPSTLAIFVRGAAKTSRHGMIPLFTSRRRAA